VSAERPELDGRHTERMGDDRKRLTAGIAAALLLAFGIYNVVVLVRALSEGTGHGSVFYFTIGAIAVIALVCGGAAFRIWRTRFARHA
jgi:hypothetical protein